MPKVICISGGIGSGKSVVSRMLRAMGYPVYDTDSEAKRIMDEDTHIIQSISERIAAECVREGCIHRPTLASVVFSDPDKLAELNSIVHSAVRTDLAVWIDAQAKHDKVFVETAILYQSGLDKMVDEVWEVTAPEEVRIARVMARNGLTRAQVAARIQSQTLPPDTTLHPHTITLTNDNHTPLLPQVEREL